MIKEMGEKGRGLVASRDFKVGDLIFNDKLVVSIKKNTVEMTFDIVKRAQDVHAQILNLTKKEQEAFFELS